MTMNKLVTSKVLVWCLIGILGFSSTAQAQDRISISNQNGIEVFYTIQFLGSIDKKKADKSRDEYQLSVWAVNNSGQAIYGTGNTTGGVKVANAKSTRKTVRANAINSQMMTTQGQTLYMFDKGATLQGTGKIKVQKGVDPVVAFDAGTNFVGIENYDIQASAGLINATWRVENGSQAMQLTFNAEDQTIRQQGTDGRVIVWYKVGPKTFQRSFSGGARNLSDQTVDTNQTYVAKITIIGIDSIQYSNSEGINIKWMKQ